MKHIERAADHQARTLMHVPKRYKSSANIHVRSTYSSSRSRVASCRVLPAGWMLIDARYLFTPSIHMEAQQVKTNTVHMLRTKQAVVEAARRVVQQADASWMPCQWCTTLTITRPICSSCTTRAGLPASERSS